jgi:uncharacterized peroxidase-related enzyme
MNKGKLMTCINVIDEANADAEFRSVYKKVKRKRGKLSNILRIHNLLPKSMLTHLDLYMSIMFDKTGLKRQDKELIATFVSAAKKCDHCINHHAEALKHYWETGEKVKLTAKNFRELDLSVKQITMLEFAEKPALHPGEMNENDVKKPGDAGLTDKEILNLILVVSYFNFVNRNAAALGVEFTEEEMRGYKY